MVVAGAATEENAIDLEGVRKTYGEGAVAVEALRGINVRIERGQFVAVLGPSGSGKTTLLNVVGGIEPVTDGRITVDGADVAAMNERERTAFRQRVGYVFQFFNLIPTLTALENVELVLELTGRPADPAAIRALLAEVGLEDRGDHFPAQLSGGEQQRVAIARALAKDPSILFCDEPTGALDLDTGRLIIGLLREVSSGGRRTVMLVTHNSAIARTADRILRMRSGELVADERVQRPIPPDELEW